MSIEKIGIDRALLNLKSMAGKMEPLSGRLSADRKIRSPGDDPSGWIKAGGSSSALGDLQSVKEGLNKVAANIRASDKNMETIGDYIDRMKAQAMRVIKNYPPFPPGSEKRIEMLRRFNAFRNQIDQLTIPPAEKGARQIMADPAGVPEAGDWNIVAGKNGGFKVIHRQEVHTGRTGLNIPELRMTATDAEIEAAVANLDTAKEMLARRRAGLSADASVLNSSMVEESQYAEMTETTAESRSEELRHELAMQSIVDLTRTRTQIFQLLR